MIDGTLFKTAESKWSITSTQPWARKYQVKKMCDTGLLMEYIVDMRLQTCTCKGFRHYVKPCKHIKFIVEQLKDNGGVIL